MGKELSVISLTKSDDAGNEFLYSRVFCQRKDPPQLRLLLDFFKIEKPSAPHTQNGS